MDYKSLSIASIVLLIIFIALAVIFLVLWLQERQSGFARGCFGFLETQGGFQFDGERVLVTFDRELCMIIPVKSFSLQVNRIFALGCHRDLFSLTLAKI